MTKQAAAIATGLERACLLVVSFWGWFSINFIFKIARNSGSIFFGKIIALNCAIFRLPLHSIGKGKGERERKEKGERERRKGKGMGKGKGEWERERERESEKEKGKGERDQERGKGKENGTGKGKVKGERESRKE